MSGEQETALVALFDRGAYAEIPAKYLPIVSPYIWYRRPDGVIVTPVETADDHGSLPMELLIMASHPDFDMTPDSLMELLGLPAGTVPFPPAAWKPPPGQLVLAVNNEGTILCCTVTDPATAAVDGITRVLAEYEAAKAPAA